MMHQEHIPCTGDLNAQHRAPGAAGGDAGDGSRLESSLLAQAQGLVESGTNNTL